MGFLPNRVTSYVNPSCLFEIDNPFCLSRVVDTHLPDLEREVDVLGERLESLAGAKATKRFLIAAGSGGLR